MKTRTGDIKQKGANLFPGYHRLQSAVSNTTYNTIPGAIAIDTHGSTRTTTTSPISFLASPQWIQLNARHSTCKMSLTTVSWSITSVALGEHFSQILLSEIHLRLEDNCSHVHCLLPVVAWTPSGRKAQGNSNIKMSSFSWQLIE